MERSIVISSHDLIFARDRVGRAWWSWFGFGRLWNGTADIVIHLIDVAAHRAPDGIGCWGESHGFVYRETDRFPSAFGRPPYRLTCRSLDPAFDVACPLSCLLFLLQLSLIFIIGAGVGLGGQVSTNRQSFEQSYQTEEGSCGLKTFRIRDFSKDW